MAGWTARWMGPRRGSPPAYLRILLALALALLPFAQAAAMAAAAFLIASERLDHAAAPRWTCRFSGKLLRLLVAQTRIRLQAVAS